MKAFILGIAATLALTGAASAQSSHAVRGYMRSNGTYVAPHTQTNPNSTRLDNWSTKGNTNPYTGQPGTKDPYPTPSRSTNPYSSSYRPSSSSLGSGEESK